MIGPLRKPWSAASAPARFFATRDEDDPRPLRAFGVALTSWAVGAAVSGLALALATGSDVLVVLLATVGLSLPYLVLVWGLGGLALVRPARLDIRAWEIAAWAWVPAGFLGVALLPVVPFAPLVALAVGILLLPPWNMFVVVGGLRACAPPERIRGASLLYLTVVFVAPLAFLGIAFLLVGMGT